MKYWRCRKNEPKLLGSFLVTQKIKGDFRVSDWEVFQTDVLDVFRQYQGFFDFFERVGNLTDDSRPDCFARVTREEKKEIWVIDAKNKGEISQEDRNRMDKYMEMIESNPIDVELEITELSEHDIRGIFITSRKPGELDNYEAVGFRSLHQFLQKELIYTDTDKVVRDVAKMVERKQLSQEQARLLFRSIKPFEERVDEAMQTLEDLEEKYSGLRLKKPPFDSYSFQLPVDAILIHEKRNKAFLFDIPYSWEAVKNVDEKVDEVKNALNKTEKEVFYTAINTFDSYDSRYVIPPEEAESKLKEEAGIVSPVEVAELFTPKIPTDTTVLENKVEVVGKNDLNFRLEVESLNDTQHHIQAEIPSDAVDRMKDSLMNSRKEFGETLKTRFAQKIEVTEEMEVKYGDTREGWKAYRDSVKSIYQASVNPVLSKKMNEVVQKNVR